MAIPPALLHGPHAVRWGSRATPPGARRRNRRFEKENVAQLAVDYVRAKYPFYARSNGTDHIILTNEDWGSCQLDGPSGRGFLPPFLEPLIVLTVWAHSLNMAMGTERPCFRPGRDIAIPPLMVPNVYR